ncbi:hypothetical protein GF380_04655 [Candidatus Uhrbacteria bacterium]|nr:hypothetical protein [Candidatus Uhrbacteria bacterium]MBD3284346.1 hypothetical protein [Candidatus Uhrbacteria bacterium]
MVELPELLSRNSLIIFVGSLQSGLLFHLEQLYKAKPNAFAPVRTITANRIRREASRWYGYAMAKVPSSDLAVQYFDRSSPTNTLYKYGVLYEHLFDALDSGRVPILGMTSEGYEHLIYESTPPCDRCEHCGHEEVDQRWSKMIRSHLVVPLVPDELSGFTDAFAIEHHLALDAAVELTEELKRSSTLPPPLTERPSGIYQVSLSSTRDETFLEKFHETLSSAS